MILSVYVKREYVCIELFLGMKKQSQTKPIDFVLSSAFSVLRQGLSKGYLKKQSQFAEE
jgi:hypothetical protein